MIDSWSLPSIGMVVMIITVEIFKANENRQSDGLLFEQMKCRLPTSYVRKSKMKQNNLGNHVGGEGT